MLQHDASDLYDAATAFIRVYQFRDRNHALRHDLTVVQAYTLDILVTSDGRTLKDLSESLRLDKSTMSRIVSGMARRRLIEWSRPEHDQRAMWIVASPEGRRRYEALRRAIVGANARLLTPYSLAERRAVIRILRQLTARAEAALGPATGSRRRNRRTRAAQT